MILFKKISMIRFSCEASLKEEYQQFSWFGCTKSVYLTTNGKEIQSKNLAEKSSRFTIRKPPKFKNSLKNSGLSFIQQACTLHSKLRWHANCTSSFHRHICCSPASNKPFQPVAPYFFFF